VYRQYRISPDFVISREKPEDAPHWVFTLSDCPDEALTKKELYTLLITHIGVGVEEVAMMNIEFQKNPDATHAFFGILGRFMYVS